MLTKVHTSTIVGVDAQSVDVEVEIGPGKPRFVIIGLADSAVRESRDRVTAAIQNSGFELPDQILVNLAPAEIKKEGSAFDLPIAMAILSASLQLKIRNASNAVFFGELSLDGKLKPIRGMLALAIEARQRGMTNLFIPDSNFREASLIQGLHIFPARSLREAVAHCRGESVSPRALPALPAPETAPAAKLISEVWGQESAKRALLIAAAGGHNLIMIGPPGCGKSMLAERFASILPPLSENELLEAVRVHSIAGMPTSTILNGQRPYRSPHHGISDAGLIGGGSNPRPGEISLAHSGVLFLDEFPEFRRSALEALRAPLESGIVQISRAKGSIRIPARFMLLAAMNPCPCGRLGMTTASCTCSRSGILNYLKKLSQPILDRIDLHVELAPVLLTGVRPVAPDIQLHSEEVLREKVNSARRAQLERQGKTNSQLSGEELSRRIAASSEVVKLLEQACDKRGLSARAYVRILRVARTIADIEGSDGIESQHVSEALSYRSLERIEKYCLAA